MYRIVFQDFIQILAKSQSEQSKFNKGELKMINNMGMLMANIPVWLGIIFVAVALGAGVICGYFVDKQVLMKKLGKA